MHHTEPWTGHDQFRQGGGTMTKIISRLYGSASQARRVRRELIEMQRFSPRIVDLFDKTDGLVDALTAADVEAATAQEYEEHVKKGGAVIVVKVAHVDSAHFLGHVTGDLHYAKRTKTRDVAKEMGAVDMCDHVEEVYVK